MKSKKWAVCSTLDCGDGLAASYTQFTTSVTAKTRWVRGSCWVPVSGMMGSWSVLHTGQENMGPRGLENVQCTIFTGSRKRVKNRKSKYRILVSMWGFQRQLSRVHNGTSRDKEWQSLGLISGSRLNWVTPKVLYTQAKHWEGQCVRQPAGAWVKKVWWLASDQSSQPITECWLVCSGWRLSPCQNTGEIAVLTLVSSFSDSSWALQFLFFYSAWWVEWK